MGKETNNKIPLYMNNLIIQTVANCDTWKYLGQDEDIMYLGEVNKEKLQKELYVSCRKVLSSEISAYNKVTAHNIFVITIITLTFGIINWTVEELKEINNRTCKILSMNNSFHPDLNIDIVIQTAILILYSIYHDTKVERDLNLSNHYLNVKLFCFIISLKYTKIEMNM